MVNTRCFSGADYKQGLGDQQTENEQQSSQNSDAKHFRKFQRVYSKPKFLQDDYDHLRKDKNHATI